MHSPVFSVNEILNKNSILEVIVHTMIYDRKKSKLSKRCLKKISFYQNFCFLPNKIRFLIITKNWSVILRRTIYLVIICLRIITTENSKNATKHK